MNVDQNGQNGYMLIFRGTDWYKGLSPEQMQQVGDKWMAWFKGLMAEGRCVAGNPLEPGGKVVGGRSAMVSDGPFVETKETIGGYFLLSVKTFEEAVEIARQCPGLPYGIRVEVRTVAGECPILEQTRPKVELAEA